MLWFFMQDFPQKSSSNASKLNQKRWVMLSSTNCIAGYGVVNSSEKATECSKTSCLVTEPVVYDHFCWMNSLTVPKKLSSSQVAATKAARGSSKITGFFQRNTTTTATATASATATVATSAPSGVASGGTSDTGVVVDDDDNDNEAEGDGEGEAS